jgi:hypothetical protein
MFRVSDCLHRDQEFTHHSMVRLHGPGPIEETAQLPLYSLLLIAQGLLVCNTRPAGNQRETFGPAWGKILIHTVHSAHQK